MDATQTSQPANPSAQKRTKIGLILLGVAFSLEAAGPIFSTTLMLHPVYHGSSVETMQSILMYGMFILNYLMPLLFLAAGILCFRLQPRILGIGILLTILSLIPIGLPFHGLASLLFLWALRSLAAKPDWKRLATIAFSLKLACNLVILLIVLATELFDAQLFTNFHSLNACFYLLNAACFIVAALSAYVAFQSAKSLSHPDAQVS